MCCGSMAVQDEWASTNILPLWKLLAWELMVGCPESTHEFFWHVFALAAVDGSAYMNLRFAALALPGIGERFGRHCKIYP